MTLEADVGSHATFDLVSGVVLTHLGPVFPFGAGLPRAGPGLACWVQTTREGLAGQRSRPSVPAKGRALVLSSEDTDGPEGPREHAWPQG